MLHKTRLTAGFMFLQERVILYVAFPPLAVDGSTHISICVGVLDPPTAKCGSVNKKIKIAAYGRDFYFF